MTDEDTRDAAEGTEGALPLTGRDRWEVVHVEGDAHGGPWELEIEHTFQVLDRRTGERVLELTGEYTARLGGHCEWVDGRHFGVRRVEIDEEGRHALVYGDGGELERIPLPA